MSTRRILVLVASLVIAAVAGVAAYGYLSGVQDRANNHARLVQVYRVQKDIPKALGGDQAISGGYIASDKIQAKFRPTTSLINLDAIRGKVALTPLAANTVLVSGQFVEPRVAQLTNSQRITKGHVAITVSVDQIHGVAGLLVPGDKVDILIRVRPATASGQTAAAAASQASTNDIERFLYQNVQILFIGGQAAPQPGETSAAVNPGSNLITFDVPAEAAERIAVAAEKDDLYLTLVPPDNTPTVVAPVTETDVSNTSDLTPYDHEAK